jgi:hypothetical protein
VSLTVNVGRPREVEWQEHAVRTSSWKPEVPDHRWLTRLNAAGDALADAGVARRLAGCPGMWASTSLTGAPGILRTRASTWLTGSRARAGTCGPRRPGAGHEGPCSAPERAATS